VEETRETRAPTVPQAQAAPVDPEAPSWRDQLAGLRAIRDAAAAERHGDTLAAIEAYRRRFSAPAFDQELLLLEAQARWARGDHTACGVIERLMTTYPNSLLVPRARALRSSARCDSRGE
jgi:hypothetical protein